MFGLILPWLSSFLGGPIVNGLLAAYKDKLNSEDTKHLYLTNLAQRELAVQQRELELQTEYRIASIGKWYEPDHLMGYAVAFYFAKLLVWDKVLALGVTDPLAGWAATSANLIIGFYFGSRAFSNVMRIWRLK
jgi:hypothetical protein